MPKIEIQSKFVKDDVVYFIFNNGIVKGRIHSANVYAVFGLEENPLCQHQMQDNAWSEFGDEPIDAQEPMIEYFIEIDHPLINVVGGGKMVLEKVIGSTRLFRDPGALIAYLKRKFVKAYEQEI